MLPLYQTASGRGASRSSSGSFCSDLKRQHVLIAFGLVMCSFTLILILLVNSDLGSIETETFYNGFGQKIESKASPVKPKTEAVYEHAVDDEAQKKQADKEVKKKPMNLVKSDLTDKRLSIEELKSLTDNDARREAIVGAFKEAWRAYKETCGDHDELQPVTKKCRDWFGLGLTRIDALDTMYLMSLHDEFYESVEWLKKHFNLDQDSNVSVFEGTIRIIGGLLSAFDLSGEWALFDMAKAFADLLLPSFSANGPGGMPNPIINLKTGKSGFPSWLSGKTPLSEVGTLQMEFSYLSHISGDPKYANAALNIYKVLRKHPLDDGLYATFINPGDGSGATGTATLNAPGDSMYEYLLKTWLLLGKSVHWLEEMWQETSSAILEKMLVQDGENTYLAAWSGGRTGNLVEQLACFGAGMMALSSKHESDKEIAAKEMEVGQGFAQFCHQMYAQSRSGLVGEQVTVSNKKIQRGHETSYQLRPETVETFFYLWRTTGDQKYRNWAWDIFFAIERHCRVASGGYSGVKGVYSDKVLDQDDVQPSWFLAEVLKYLFLTYSDTSVIPLDKYVFNTEAHPLSIFKPNSTSFGKSISG